MGSKEIWVFAALAYGVLSGLVYALIARYQGYKGKFVRRFVVWSFLYTAFAFAVASVLWHFLAEKST